MSIDYASHFGISNIPYGIASSTKRPKPQCVTRIANEVIFLDDVKASGVFQNIGSLPPGVFGNQTLNDFAALSKDIHSRVRTTIQQAYENGKLKGASEHVKDVIMHLPVRIGDFTDFSASKDHVLNAGEAIMGQRSFPPGFLRFPIAYAGRSSSISVSGSPCYRPHGHFIEDYAAPEKKIIFGPSRALDYELEVGAVVGRAVEPGKMLKASDADKHIFGLVLVNDWSSRDIQALEMNPLGPLNGKNFATSISPWIVTLEALESFKVPAPARDIAVTAFLDDKESVNYAIKLEAQVIRNEITTTTCQVGFNTMYWTFRHMLAHHTIGGCGLRTGDLIASGTVSGQGDDEHGCLLELTFNGRKPVTLKDGAKLRYLEDGDEVRFTGRVGIESDGVGFGECVGVVKPARQ